MFGEMLSCLITTALSIFCIINQLFIRETMVMFAQSIPQFPLNRHSYRYAVLFRLRYFSELALRGCPRARTSGCE